MIFIFVFAVSRKFLLARILLLDSWLGSFVDLHLSTVSTSPLISSRTIFVGFFRQRRE